MKYDRTVIFFSSDCKLLSLPSLGFYQFFIKVEKKGIVLIRAIIVEVRNDINLWNCRIF